MNGHTSGVRLFGSDETNTGYRERRRRMRADNDAFASGAIESKRLNEKARGHSCEERNDLLFSNSVLRERL